MLKLFFSFGAATLIFSLGLTFVLRATPITDNIKKIDNFLSGPAAKVYPVTPTSEVLWQPGSSEENDTIIIYL